MEKCAGMHHSGQRKMCIKGQALVVGGQWDAYLIEAGSRAFAQAFSQETHARDHTGPCRFSEVCTVLPGCPIFHVFHHLT